MSWTLGVLLTTAGCGAVLSTAVPSVETTHSVMAARSAGAAREGSALLGAEPDCARVARSMLTTIPFPKRMTRGVGYYWIGYITTDIGIADLEEAGSGEGFSFGFGVKFTEASRSFFEIAYEKTIDHQYPEEGNVRVDGETGQHERFSVGGRTAAAAEARLENQPRAYASYGASTSKFVVGNAEQPYEAAGVGLYLGMGVEFPLAEKASFSFDTKYHTWSDQDRDERYGVLAFSLLWLLRF